MSSFTKSIQQAVDAFQSLSALEENLNKAVEIVVASLTSGGKLLICGNGGSAADSAHLATEFVCRFKEDRRPYPAMALGVDGGLLTAIGNDYQFQEIFSRQVRAFGRPEDVLIVLTTSGKSRNILYALEEARRSGMRTIALLGRGGGFTAGAADVELLVECEVTARIQEAQKFLLHCLCDMAEEKLPKE